MAYGYPTLRLVSSAAAALAAALVALPSAALSAGTVSTARELVVPILLYHRIDFLRPSLPPITRRLTVDPGDFARQMSWLQEHGFHTLTQEQLLEALSRDAALPSRPILITFDDGYRDVLGKASHVLMGLGFRGTDYVISGRLSGEDSSFLTVPELRVLEQRGIEIGSHTVTHAPLAELGNAEALAQLVSSRRMLEEALGHAVPWLAYPYGSYDDRVVALAAQAGYRLAVTMRPGACQSSSRPLELERLEVLDSTGVDGLAALLSRGC
ncbi:MAG: polysaccharide deacetylase family protein [Thermoleophilia bacterium]|nr:polysaccharide deacetylase family protein [Thermoleophilia bacterium]